MEGSVISDVTRCSLLKFNQCFGETFASIFRLQEAGVKQAMSKARFPICLPLSSVWTVCFLSPTDSLLGLFFERLR
jgi:hypothetical protein